MATIENKTEQKTMAQPQEPKWSPVGIRRNGVFQPNPQEVARREEIHRRSMMEATGPYL